METSETNSSLSLTQLFGQMFINPKRGYAYIRDNRSTAWIWVALIVLILAALVSYGVQLNTFALMEAQFVPPEEDFGFEVPPPSFGLFNILPILLAPVGRLAIWLVWAGSILVCVSLFGGRTGFGKMWQLAVWASIPFIISLALNIIYLFTGESVEPLSWSLANFMENPVQSFATAPPPGQPFPGPPDTSSVVLYSLAQRVDLFAFWQLTLLSIGTMTIGKLSFGKSISIVLILWILGSLITILPTAVFAGGVF
ncbi:MAG: Yip1 family protein [Chloroflexota bacterium]